MRYNEPSDGEKFLMVSGVFAWWLVAMLVIMLAMKGAMSL